MTPPPSCVAGFAACSEGGGGEGDPGRRGRAVSQPQRVITSGRAYVRLIEAADALLGYCPAWTEALLSRRLRGLVRALPPEMGAEILAASEKIEGPVQGVGRN
jgi:hypothetical protein